MDLIERTIREQLGLLTEYSNKILQLLYTKFSKEQPDLSQQQIKFYIDRFDQIKSSPKVTQKDILKYSFQELEQLVDGFGNNNKKNIPDNLNTAEVKGEEIYSKDGVEVYLGDDRDKCVRYRKAFQGDTNQHYSWCISRSDSSNMFTNYRYGAGRKERIFYFVINRNLPTTDPYHVFVIHVFSNGTYGITDANNSGDKTDLDWTDLLTIVPVLKNIPQDLFKAKPLSTKEKEIYQQVQGIVNADDLFYYFKNYETVKAYIEIKMHRLTDNQLGNLLKQNHTDLVNLYINLGHCIINGAIVDKLPNNLFDNYIRVGKIVWEQTKNYESVGLSRYLVLYTLKVTDRLPSYRGYDYELNLSNKIFDLMLTNLEYKNLYYILDTFSKNIGITDAQLIKFNIKYPTVNIGEIINSNEHLIKGEMVEYLLEQNKSGTLLNLIRNNNLELDVKAYQTLIKYKKFDLIEDYLTHSLDIIPDSTINIMRFEDKKIYIDTHISTHSYVLPYPIINLMLDIGYRLDWLDVNFPDVRILSELKKNYPDMNFVNIVGKMKYGNQTIGVAIDSGNEDYFVNIHGLLDTDGITKHDIEEKMGTIDRITYFRQRYGLNFKYVNNEGNGLIATDESYRPYFIDDSGRLNKSAIKNKNIYDYSDWHDGVRAAYVNTFLGKVTYCDVEVSRDGIIGYLPNDTKVILNPQTLQPLKQDTLTEYVENVVKKLI